MTTRGVNNQRETQECTHVHAPLSLSFLVSPLSLLCFDKRSRGKPCRTLRHLSSEVRPGQHDHFAVTMLSQHKIGKTDSTHEKATCSAHYIPLPPIFPLLRWEDGGCIKTLHPTWQGPIWETGSKVFTIDTWPVLQKYWLRRPDIHWMALKGYEVRFLNTVFMISAILHTS